MPAPSLLHLATATAVKHVKIVTDIGALPYALVRPILLKVDNPEKLHSLETLSPHIAEEDKEIWIEFIKRDIPQWDRYDLPDQTNKWYEVYCDLREDVQRSLDADAARMKMAIDGIKSEKARLTPKIISGPRMRPTARQRHAIHDRKMGGIAPIYSRPAGAESWSLQAPSIPRSDYSSSKKKSIFAPQRRNNALAIPTKHLSNRASQVKQAPRALIEEHRRPADQSAAKRNQQAARPPSAPARDTKSTSLAEREARLRAIASGKPPPAQSSTHTRKAQTPGGCAPSLKKTPLKRVNTSSESSTTEIPVNPTSSSPRTEPVPSIPPSSTKTPPRPAVVRKRPDSVFIQPKRRRLV